MLERNSQLADKNILREKVIRTIENALPFDAEQRVKRTCKVYNQIIRKQIRDVTGLKLSIGDDVFSVPIGIDNGFPAPLSNLIDDHPDPMFWILILAQPRLSETAEGIKLLLNQWYGIQNSSFAIPQNIQLTDNYSSLQVTQEIIDYLQKKVAFEDIQTQLRTINEDILGSYFFPPGKNSYIRLYWIPISMISAMLDIRIEDLTVVVMSHELAHAYTHLGRDIDGAQWDRGKFEKTNLNILEGLAQFYTEVIVSNLAERTPGPKDAYSKFLNLQGGPYLVHQNWLNDKKDVRGEAIRSAMISARNKGITEYSQWQELLNDADTRLSKKYQTQRSIFDT